MGVYRSFSRRPRANHVCLWGHGLNCGGFLLLPLLAAESGVERRFTDRDLFAVESAAESGFTDRGLFVMVFFVVAVEESIADVTVRLGFFRVPAILLIGD
jgi:hypothetical protein